jgi:hypothetical protein
MSVDLDSEPFLHKAVGPDMVLVIVGVDDSFRGMLFKVRHQLPRRIAAPRVDKKPVHKIGGDPVDGISPDLPAHADLGNLLKPLNFDHSFLLLDN